MAVSRQVVLRLRRYSAGIVAIVDISCIAARIAGYRGRRIICVNAEVAICRARMARNGRRWAALIGQYRGGRTGQLRETHTAIIFMVAIRRQSTKNGIIHSVGDFAVSAWLGYDWAAPSSQLRRVEERPMLP